MLSSQEIGTLITALGTGIGRDEFDIEKLRYHKIVIMTDADVDGAHIRTLLLTFFFRKMREIVDGGYLFIAQPPLYKVSRGKSEVYLKDEGELEKYLIQMGLENTTLRMGNGVTIAGSDLDAVLQETRKIINTLSSFPTKYSRFILEQAAISGAFDLNLSDLNPSKVAEKLAERLDACSEEYEKGWLGCSTEDGGLKLSRTVRGVEEVRIIDGHTLRSAEAIKLNEMITKHSDIYKAPALIKTKSKEEIINSPMELFAAVMSDGEKGLTLQRYKGLGEMNPDQLWETTLDPDARTLLQVKIDREEAATDIFSKLMGDVVEPRREFIQQNALNVSNLDF
jgi:DNA gyrase subunit B